MSENTCWFATNSIPGVADAASPGVEASAGIYLELEARVMKQSSWCTGSGAPFPIPAHQTTLAVLEWRVK
jgi:hypothetical protein